MNTLVNILFSILKTTTSLFPLGFSRFRAKIWGYFFYYVIPIRKKVAIQNIKLCFPDISQHEINSIIKEAYINVITVIFEFLYFPKLNKEKLKKQINITNPELIIKKLEDKKGLILIGAHFGNWELMAYGVSQLVDEPFHVIVKEQSNKKIDKKINGIRELHGNKMIEMKQSFRVVLNLLRDNKIIAMIGDQSAPADTSVKVKFFIPDVPMFEGASRFAIKTGAPILFGVSFRNKDGSYSITLKDIDTKKYNVYNEENIKSLTQEHTSILEKAIKEKPGHWLWFHKKFKHLIKYN